MEVTIVDNFFNKLCNKIDMTYFPNVKYYRDNPKTEKCHYYIELFNNGIITYSRLISKLSNECNDTIQNIHTIVSNFVKFK